MNLPTSSPRPLGARCIVLDTCAIRSVVEGDERAKPLSALVHRGIRASLGEVTVIELLHQLHTGRIAWERWRAAMPLVSGIIDDTKPVVQPAAHVAVRRPAARARQLASMNASAKPVAVWSRLRDARTLEELAEPFGTTSAFGTTLTVSLNRDHAERIIGQQRERWAEFVEGVGPNVARIREVQRAVKSARSQGARLSDSDQAYLGAVERELVADGRPHLAGITRAAFHDADERLDAYSRVSARRLEEHSHRRYNPRGKKRNDGLDVLQLILLAVPAVLCTTDDKLIGLVLSIGSHQAGDVLTPAQLVRRLAAGDAA